MKTAETSRQKVNRIALFSLRKQGFKGLRAATSQDGSGLLIPSSKAGPVLQPNASVLGPCSPPAQLRSVLSFCFNASMYEGEIPPPSPPCFIHALVNPLGSLSHPTSLVFPVSWGLSPAVNARAAEAGREDQKPGCWRGSGLGFCPGPCTGLLQSCCSSSDGQRRRCRRLEQRPLLLAIISPRGIIEPQAGLGWKGA